MIFSRFQMNSFVQSISGTIGTSLPGSNAFFSSRNLKYLLRTQSTDKSAGPRYKKTSKRFKKGAETWDDNSTLLYWHPLSSFLQLQSVWDSNLERNYNCWPSIHQNNMLNYRKGLLFNGSIILQQRACVFSFEDRAFRVIVLKEICHSFSFECFSFEFVSWFLIDEIKVENLL